MSVVALLIAIGAPQAGADRREEMFSVGQAIRFEEPIGPAVDQYQTCLSDNLKGQSLVPDQLDQIFEGTIQKCASVRSGAIRVADQLLRDAGSSDAAKRSASIMQTFDDIDADHRGHGKRLKAHLEQISHPITNERG